MAATQTVGWIRSHGRKATAFALFALVLLTALAFASSSNAAVESPPPPSVWSDKADYAPGELVTLSGANWAPGESIHIRVNDDAGETWRRDVDVIADESGAISDQFNLPDWFVADYSVTATGASSGNATWSFTDGNVTAVSLSIRKSNCSTASASFATGDTVCAHSAATAITGNGIGDYWIQWVPPSGTATTVAHNNVTTANSADDSLGVNVTGTWTIRACSNSSCSSVLTSATFSVKQSQTITFIAPSGKTYGDADFNPGATASSGLAVSYSSSTPSVCTIVSGNIHIVAAGGCTVTASQGGNATFAAADDVTRTFTVAKADQAALSVTSPDDGTYGDKLVPTASGGSGTGALSFTASGTACEMGSGADAGKLVITSGTGTCSVTAHKATDANYNAADSAAHAVTVHKADQAITVDTSAPASQVYNTSFTVAASSSSGLAVSYSASGVCSNVGATFTMTSGTGTCTVHYNQAGNANYNAAPEKTEDVEAAKANQTISFVQPTSPRTFGDSFNVTPTASSGLAVSVAASGGCTATASGGGYSVEMTSGTNDCVLTASQGGNANHNAASDVQRTVVAQKAPANLAFDLSGLSAKTFGDDDFSVASYATSNSGAAKQFVLGAGSSGCTVTSGGLVHITGAAVGTDFCVISVSQDPTANYLADGPISQSFHIAKANQTISFGALSPKLLGDPPFVVSATGGASGNPVTFSAGPSSICTSGGTNGTTITITGVGTCTVTANQAGNSNYSAAGPVSRTFGITYLWTGFLQPINDTAHQTGVTESKFKLGQTIPAKFVIKNALGTVVQQSPNPTFSRSGNLGACDSNATPDVITEVVAPDSGVTYSWDGSQYHYNWSTKGLTGGEYRIYANLADGTKRYVDICLTK